LKNLGRLLGPIVIFRRMELLLIEKSRSTLWAHLTVLRLRRRTFSVIVRLPILDAGRIYLLSRLRHSGHKLLRAQRLRRGTGALHQAHQKFGIVIVDWRRILLKAAAALVHAVLALGK
jgi:hypothetical protein